MKAALDAAGVVTYSTLLMVVKGADHEPSTFVAEGTEV